MGALKFVQTVSKQVARYKKDCRGRTVKGLQIAETFGPRLYAWLLSEHPTEPQGVDSVMKQLVETYPRALWSRLNFQTQEWYEDCAFMSCRVYFATTDTFGLDIDFVNREQSKGFGFFIKLNGDVALVVNQEIQK